MVCVLYLSHDAGGESVRRRGLAQLRAIMAKLKGKGKVTGPKYVTLYHGTRDSKNLSSILKRGLTPGPTPGTDMHGRIFLGSKRTAKAYSGIGTFARKFNPEWKSGALLRVRVAKRRIVNRAGVEAFVTGRIRPKHITAAYLVDARKRMTRIK